MTRLRRGATVASLAAARLEELKWPLDEGTGDQAEDDERPEGDHRLGVTVLPAKAAIRW